MGKKISFNKAAKACLDYVNKANQNCIWSFAPKNLPNPAKVFTLHAAEKVAAEKANPPKKGTFRRIKVKATAKRRGWKRRSWKRTRKILTEARKAKF